MLVEGIGSVELPVKRSPSSSGRNGHTTLHLTTVLHIPQAICNVLGQPIAREYKLDTNLTDPLMSPIRDQQGRSLAYFRKACGGQQLALRLSGPPVGPKVGPSPLAALGTENVSVKAVWPATERQRWASHRPPTNTSGESEESRNPPPSLTIKSTSRPKKTHPQQPANPQPVSASKPPHMGNSPRQPREDPHDGDTNRTLCASIEPLGENFIRVLSVGKETRSSFMFPSLHETVRIAVSEEIPSVWFNANDEDDYNNEYDTRIMGKFKCNNKKCPTHGWSSKKIAIWIRGYPSGGYNAVVFNQRCNSCDELGKMTLNKETYVDRISYRLRKWAGLPVEMPYYSKKDHRRHDFAHCEGCRLGHCEGQEEDYSEGSCDWY